VIVPPGISVKITAKERSNEVARSNTNLISRNFASSLLRGNAFDHNRSSGKAA
jgi:hypothetical protein